MLAYTLTLAGMESEGRTEPTILSYVSGNYFQALGLNPYQGRLIYGQETEKVGTENVMVLGYGYWKKRFNSDPSIVGKQVKLNGHSGYRDWHYAGKFSRDLRAGGHAGLPSHRHENAMAAEPDKNDDPNEYWTKRDLHDLKVLGVLKPDVTRKQAEVSANIVAQRLNQEFPESHKSVSFRLYPEKTCAA